MDFEFTIYPSPERYLRNCINCPLTDCYFHGKQLFSGCDRWAQDPVYEDKTKEGQAKILDLFVEMYNALEQFTKQNSCSTILGDGLPI